MFVVFVLVTIAVPACVMIWSVEGLSILQGIALMLAGVTVVPVAGLGLTLLMQVWLGRLRPRGEFARRIRSI